MAPFIIFGLVALVVAGVVALPFIVLAAALWLVTLPFRLLFKLVFGGLKVLLGLGAIILGVLALPLLLLVATVGLIGAVVAAILSLLAPLLPLVLLGLLGWAIYRLGARRANATI